MILKAIKNNNYLQLLLFVFLSLVFLIKDILDFGIWTYQPYLSWGTHLLLCISLSFCLYSNRITKDFFPAAIFYICLLYSPHHACGQFNFIVESFLLIAGLFSLLYTYEKNMSIPALFYACCCFSILSLYSPTLILLFFFLLLVPLIYSAPYPRLFLVIICSYATPYILILLFNYLGGDAISLPAFSEYSHAFNFYLPQPEFYHYTWLLWALASFFISIHLYRHLLDFQVNTRKKINLILILFFCLGILFIIGENKDLFLFLSYIPIAYLLTFFFHKKKEETFWTESLFYLFLAISVVGVYFF